MATSKFIYGLSQAGFRVPTNGSATALQKVRSIGLGAPVQIDIDHDKTQKILYGEKDNFIRCAASNSTTATIIGLTRYGFRIRTTASPSIKTVKLGSGVHTVDLTDGRVRRTLRRNYGRYLFAADANNVTIRGIVDKQTGFDIKGTAGFKPVTITNANPTNVSNADTVTIGASTYTFKTALTEVAATATVNDTAGTPADGNTVVVNGRTYTFKTALTPSADQVLINGGAGSMTNLSRAINQSGGVPGTDYVVGAANADVTASAVAGTTITLTAKVVGTAGNALTLVRVGANIAVSGATFTGGINSVANEVKVAGSADASLTNLSEAINAGANKGVDYSTATTANVAATASAVASHAITLTPLQGGGTTLAVTESTAGVRLTVNDAALEQPLIKVFNAVSATVDPQDPQVYPQLRRHYKSYIEL